MMSKARRIAIMVTSLLWGGFALAQEDGPQSPFAPPTVKKAVVAPKTIPVTPLDSIEFRGVVEIGSYAWVSVYDPKTKKSYRLTKDELGEDGFSLVRYDAGDGPGEETIVIRQGGLTKQLSLKDADIITLQEAPRQAPQRAAASVQPTPSAPVRNTPANGNPNMEAASDEEVRERMQRVAEEIRRRRALRSNIINDGN